MSQNLRTFVQERHIRFVRVAWCDNANVIRAKAIHSGVLGDYLEHGVGISAGQQGVPVMVDAVVPDSGLGPVGEIRVVPDPTTLVQLPYAPTHARCMGDMILDGKPWACCPRHFLRRMVEAAKEAGLEVKGAFENEFYLLRFEDDNLMPADETPFASTQGFDAGGKVMDDLADALLEQGIPVELYHPESGPGQHEMSTRYCDALQAADRQVAFRETVHAVASRHGLKASFVPKIFPDKAGNGCHLHLSLWEGERNLLPEAQAPHLLSAVARSFMAGLLEHLPAVMAVTTPSTNSYRRLQPHSWCGAYRCWGPDNREAAIRVPSTPAGPGPTHFEFKTVDASSNPYLALGAVIAAGLDGVRRSLDLPEPVLVDPGNLSDEERKKRRIDRLPQVLGDALRQFKRDNVLQQAFGKDLARAYVAVRAAEIDALKGLDLESEVEILLERY